MIESALYKAGAISDENVGTLEKIKWQVAARTDRGVSAAGNVISAKLLFRRDECDRPDALSLMCGRINAELPVHVRLFAIRRVTASFSARTSCGGRWYEYLLPLSAFGESPSLETFNRTLEAFVGTHSFHNFTAGAEHVAPPRRQATRYITKAMCDEEPLWLGDSKWIRICLQGQSFLLHQIRKMISLALLTHLGLAPADSIERSFRNDTLINIPPAPSVGLFLDCCHFDWYNKRHRNVLPERISVSDFEEDRERFKLKYILPSIARRAAEEDSMGIYFRTVEAYPIEFT